MEPTQRLEPGQVIEVRQRYTSGWARGFEVDEVDGATSGAAVWVRRQSDGTRLPTRFPLSEIRQA